MTRAQSLQSAREDAEEAAPLKLGHLTGCLVLLRRVNDQNPFVAWAVVVDEQPRELGKVIVRFSRAVDALAMSLSGWIVVRVAPGGRVVGPLASDYDIAQAHLKTFAAAV